VARAFSVRDVYEGVAAVRDPRYQRLARWAAERRRLSLRAGARLAWDGVQIDVLGPRPPARAPATAGNEQSLVLRLRYRAVSLLLMGDAPRAVEEQLELPRADVLKVAHHGSRTGTGPALLERARPRLAVVSVGSASPYGHPHPEVLERLLRAGARVFRTDRDGTLEVASDGVRVWLFGALGGAAESR
jgi:competence protein ComEC